MEIKKNYRESLFPVAYNILGSVEDARDVIQEVMVDRLQRNGDTIDNEWAYLRKSVIHRAINLKKRNRRMAGDYTWLPEPVATGEGADQDLKSREILSYSMLVLLEHLKPKQRAVFLMKEMFDYSHEEIAEIFSLSVDNSRQLLRRAKRTLKDEEVRQLPDRGKHSVLISQYVDAIRGGKMEQLQEMLLGQITAQTDGGGKVPILSAFTEGARDVAGLLIEVYKRFLRNYNVTIAEVNHMPALLFYNGETLVCCQVLDIDVKTGRMGNIFSVVDPVKLKNIKNY